MLIIAMLCTLSSVCRASSITMPPSNTVNVEKVCLLSPSRCLKVVDAELKHTAKESRRWFDLLQYRFDALFNLKQFTTLREETRPWVNREDVPLPFQITSLIYFAKSSFSADEIEAGKCYAQRAAQKLELLHTTFPNPMRLIELANLQMYTDELEKAYASLQVLEHEYRESKNARFMMELHGNLGHLSHQLGDINASLKYWLTTKEWSFKFGNKQQIATVTHNLAKIYSQLGDNELAIVNLRIATEMSHLAGDDIMHAQAQLLLTAVYLNAKKHCKAQFQWDSLEADVLPEYYHDRYEIVSERMKSSECVLTETNNSAFTAN